MKTNSILLILFLSCTLLSAQKKKVYLDAKLHPCDEADAEFYEVIKKEAELYSVKKYHNNGILLAEAYSSNNTEPLIYEGIVKFYNEKGQVISYMEFLHGITNGKVIDYYPNGNKKRDLTYVQGKLNGMSTDYFPTGEIAKQSNMIDDKMDGIFRQYSSPNTLMLVANLKNGNIDGLYEQYAFGRLQVKANASNNIQDGLCLEYYEDGIHVWKSYSIKNLMLDGAYYCFSEKGDTISKGYFKEGMPLSYWSKSTELIRGSIFSNEMKLENDIEKWKTYRDGLLILESAYDKGAKTGLWKMYTKDAKRLYETKYYKENSSSEKYLQKIRENFAWDIVLSSRFNLNTYPFSNNEEEAEHNEYYKIDSLVDVNDDPYYAIKSEDTFETPVIESAMIVEEIADNSEQTNTKDFLSRNHCEMPYEKYNNVTKCNQVIDGFNLIILKCRDINTLKEIQLQIIPKDNEVYLLYQDIYPSDYAYYQTRPHRYINFVVSASFKEALKNDVIDIKTINYYYENILFKDINYPLNEAISKLSDMTRK